MKRYFLPIMGGLGNQFFQFAAGLEVAQNHKLVIDCTLLNPRLNRDGMPDIMSFNLPTSIETFSGKSNRVLRKLLNLSLRLSLRNQLKTTFINRILEPISLAILKLIISFICTFRYKSLVQIVIPKNVGWHFETNLHSGNFLYGYFQSYKWFQNDVTLEKMRNINAKSSVGTLAPYKIKGISEKPVILHIRRGDYRTEPNIGLLNFEYYDKALDYVRANSTSRKVWVFSDELPAARQILDQILDFQFDYIEHFSDDSSLTFEMMRMGDVYIIANSSFSYWAATLSYNERATVICPDPWFKSEMNPADITPSNWIKIKV